MASTVKAPTGAAVRWTRLDTAILVVVALIGVTKLLLPFTGDQALFVTGGVELVDGATMYDDVWDVKQPGIYGFGAASGALFGRGEVGFHFIGLIWQLGLAIVLQRTLARRVRHRWAASVAPLLIVGPYFLGASALHLDQVESLVMFPLYLSLWWAASADDQPRRWILAGLAAAVVGLFKLVYLPVCLAAWVVVAWGRRNGARSVFAAIGATTTVGAVVVVGLAVTGVLSEVIHITFDVTPQATTIAQRPLSRLADAAVASFRFFPLIGVLAVFGIAKTPRLADPLERAALAAAVVGIPMFLIQHWWAYLLVWFLVPVGLVATFTLDRHAAQLATPLGAVLTAALVAPALVANLDLARAAATNDLGLTVAGRDAIHAELEPAYVGSREVEGLLVEPGSIHLLGNPIFFTESGRRPAVGINGWSPEQYPEEVWVDMIRQLENAEPPYLLIDEVVEGTYAQGSEGEVFGEFLRSGVYVEVGKAGGITVFARTDPR